MKRKYRVMSRMTNGKIFFYVEVKVSYFWWFLSSNWCRDTDKVFNTQEAAELHVVNEITKWAEHYSSKKLDDDYGVKKHGEYE